MLTVLIALALAVIAYQVKRFVDVVASYQPAHLKPTRWPRLRAALEPRVLIPRLYTAVCIVGLVVWALALLTGHPTH